MYEIHTPNHKVIIETTFEKAVMELSREMCVSPKTKEYWKQLRLEGKKEFTAVYGFSQGTIYKKG